MAVPKKKRSKSRKKIIDFLNFQKFTKFYEKGVSIIIPKFGGFKKFKY
jgi:hypothetical protein